ncbi:Nucleotidyltransferase, partial [Ramicandelaber brevisporus]
VSQILHNEVRMFAEYIQPTAEEHLVRELVVERIKRSVQSIWGNGAVARAFGSYATKMYLPAGDIDICVVFSDPSMTSSKPAVQRALNRLASELRKQGVPKELMVIGKARVPIIKLTERITGIKIDISMSSLTGLQCIPLVLQYAHGEFPDGLQPLVMAIKHFLAMRKMNEVFTGGLGSYATILLAVSMLQMHPLLQSGRIKASNNLGVLLLEFFELYGQRFNYERVGVCVNHGGSYFDKLQAGFGNDKQADMLCIRDPLDSTNDVARSTFGMHKVRRAFEQAYNILTTVMY